MTIDVGTTEPWRGPLGIERLEIRNVTVGGVVYPAPQLMIHGAIALSARDTTKHMDVTVRLTAGGIPTMLAGSFDEAITFLDVIEALFGSTGVPDVFSFVRLSDVELSIVPPPEPVTFAGKTYPVGYYVKGTATLFGFSGHAEIRVDPSTGLDARIELGGLNLFNVLVLSGPSEKGGPVLVVHERRSPFVEVEGSISLLGLRNDAKAKVLSDGLEVALEQSFDPVTAKIAARFGTGGATVNGSVDAMFEAEIGPIMFPGTDISLGTIHIPRTGFRGTLDAAVAPDAMTGKLNGTFDLFGLTLTVGLNVDGLRNLEDVPRLLVEELTRNAYDIFKALLGDLNRWIEWLKQRLIELVDGVAKALVNVFHQTAEAATKVLYDIGRAPEQIARELQDLGAKAEDVANALVKIAQVPVDEAKKIVKNVTGIDVGSIDLLKLPHIELPRPPHIELPPLHVDLSHFDLGKVF